jgi:hypothetical protein
MRIGRLSSLPRALRSWFQRLLSFFDARTLRGLAPAVMAVAFAPFLPPLIRLELHEPLVSDTLVFQYTGWCIRHGMRLYRDVGMADGPFIHYLHAGIQLFTGLDDRRFREFDLSLQVACGAGIGALLAPTTDPRRATRILHRAAWAAAAAALWLAYYLRLRWQWTTQREVFYSVFGLFGTVLLFVSGDRGLRASRIAIVVGAFLVTTQVFGKPTGIMYPATALLCILLPNERASVPLRARLQLFAAGAGACVLAVALAFLVSGSLTGYVHWCIRVPYRGNLFLFRMPPTHLLWTDYWDGYARMAVSAFIVGMAAIATGLLPARALPFALLPPLGFMSACLQARGYNYHVIPMLASLYTEMLVVLASLWKQASDGAWSEGRGFGAWLGLAFVGYYGFSDIQASPFRWNGDDKAWTQPEHELEDQKQAGLYVKAHTKPEDHVFAYNGGAGHAILLSAERRTASPSLHSYFLDPIGLLANSNVKPDAAQLAALTELQNDNRAMACAAILRNKPTAMVLDSLEQAVAICPPLRAMVNNDFQLATTIGALRVYLQKH